MMSLGNFSSSPPQLKREKHVGVRYFCIGGSEECGAEVDHYMGRCYKHPAPTCIQPGCKNDTKWDGTICNPCLIRHSSIR